MTVIRNHEVILTSFQQYLSCAHLTPEADCIQLFRKYVPSQLMLAADFFWQTEAVVAPTIFFFAYKEVRKLWLSIITCGLYSGNTTLSRENTARLSQNRSRNSIPPVTVSQVDTSKV